MLVRVLGQVVSSIVGIEKDGYDFDKNIDGGRSHRHHTVISKGMYRMLSRLCRC